MAFTKTAGVEYGTPAVVLSTTAGAGTNQTAIRTDGQLIAFNTSVAEGAATASTTGSAAVAARQDHKHTVIGTLPMLLAYQSSTVSNVTGGGTDATIPYDTEILDQTDNFSTPTFTAPITATYRVSVTCRFGQIASNNTYGYLWIKCSNRNWLLDLGNPYAQSGNAELGANSTTLVDMDTNDTLITSLHVYGGSDVIDIQGTSYPVTFLTISLEG